MRCACLPQSPRASFQVIAAEGEQKASKALREAAGVIAESPSALQVKPLGNNHVHYTRGLIFKFV